MGQQSNDVANKSHTPRSVARRHNDSSVRKSDQSDVCMGGGVATEAAQQALHHHERLPQSLADRRPGELPTILCLPLYLIPMSCHYNYIRYRRLGQVSSDKACQIYGLGSRVGSGSPVMRGGQRAQENCTVHAHDRFGAFVARCV
jgi:hypothetical protein